MLTHVIISEGNYIFYYDPKFAHIFEIPFAIVNDIPVISEDIMNP